MRTERYSAVEDDAGEPEFMVAAAPGVWRPESGDDSVEQYIGEYFANEDDVWPQDLFSDMYSTGCPIWSETYVGFTLHTGFDCSIVCPILIGQSPGGQFN